MSRIDPRANPVVDTIRVGRGPRAVATGEEGVGVTSELDDTVVRIDPRTNRVVETIRVGAGPAGIAIGAGAVWVASNHDRTVTRIEA
ncbi:MAG: YncE family protein [Thermoleophilaceae bacterium]